MARLAGASEPLEVPWRDVIAEDIDHPEEFFLQEGGAPGQAELALYAGRLLDLAVETQSQAWDLFWAEFDVQVKVWECQWLLKAHLNGGKMLSEDKCPQMRLNKEMQDIRAAWEKDLL
ncbi:unnamed protein product [Polarella glacialis]|uniref:Uncharacterized protein n=1 Tax=Polarella glacialis TaxID=89957 RepID=A0A813K3P4_POLGL|nr:unnamed protein product [Polarella glacialis]